jgi:hypothetical protein
MTRMRKYRGDWRGRRSFLKEKGSKGAYRRLRWISGGAKGLWS